MISSDTEHKWRTLAALRKDSGAYSTGRASLALLEGLLLMPMGRPPTQSARDPTCRESFADDPARDKAQIGPWKVYSVPTWALRRSTTANLSLSHPPLTAERRKDIVKQVKKIGRKRKLA